MRNNIHNIYFTHNKSNIVKMYQYDKGQILLFDDTFPNGTEVQFENGMTKVIFNQRILIPDIVLESAGTLKAWIQLINDDNETTVYEIMMAVEPRAKKNDYIEPEDEQSFREEVQQMIEEAKPSPEVIEPIIKEYLDEHPVEPYDDTEIKEQIKEIADSIPTLPQNVSAFENDAGYLTEHQSLEEYAKKTDIPSPYDDTKVKADISQINSSLSQKQNELISGENIKTINGNSILGSGNITISGGGGGSADIGDFSHSAYVPSVFADVSDRISRIESGLTNGWMPLTFTFEQGNISDSTGKPSTSTAWSRTSSFLECNADMKMRVDRVSGYSSSNLYIYKYNADETYIGNTKVFATYSILTATYTFEKGYKYKIKDNYSTDISTHWLFYGDAIYTDLSNNKSDTVRKTEALTVSEFNAPTEDVLNNNVLYNVFGKDFTVIHNGKIGKKADSVKFLWLSDSHIEGVTWGSNYTTYNAMIQNVNTMNDIAFGIVSGDVIDKGYDYTDTNKAERDRELEVYKNLIAPLNIPLFNLQGNHDIGCPQFSKNGVVSFGGVKLINVFATYQSTSSTDNGGLISADTLTWLESELAKGTEKKIVVCHFPLSTEVTWRIQDSFSYGGKDYDGHRDDLIELLEQYGVNYFFSGHVHNNACPTYTISSNITEVNMGATKDVYGIVEVTDSNITINVYNTSNNSLKKTITI